MRNPRLSWILLHEAIRIVGEDGNEEGKICAVTDFLVFFFAAMPSKNIQII